MIKRDKTNEDNPITYVCDNCLGEMPGAAITVYYPYGHINNSPDSPAHYCSDKCLVAFEAKLVKRFGPWKSKKETVDKKKVRSSADWRKSKGIIPKAKRVVRRTRRISRKRNIRKNDSEKGC